MPLTPAQQKTYDTAVSRYGRSVADKTAARMGWDTSPAPPAPPAPVEPEVRQIPTADEVPAPPAPPARQAPLSTSRAAPAASGAPTTALDLDRRSALSELGVDDDYSGLLGPGTGEFIYSENDIGVPTEAKSKAYAARTEDILRGEDIRRSADISQFQSEEAARRERQFREQGEIVVTGMDPVDIRSKYELAMARETQAVLTEQPKLSREDAMRVADARVWAGMTPRDIEGRTVLGPVTRTDVESRSGLAAIGTAMLPKVIKSASEAQAESDFVSQVWRTRETLADQIREGLEPGMLPSDREAAIKQGLVDRMTALRAELPEDQWYAITRVIAPTALPEGTKASKTLSVIGNMLTVEDRKTGRVSETPLSAVMRDLDVLIRTAADPTIQATTFEIDQATGKPTDPEDAGYKAWKAGIDLSTTLTETDIPIFREAGKELRYALEAQTLPNPINVWADVLGTNFRIPATLGVPFGPSTRTLEQESGRPVALESDSWSRDIAASLHGGRGMGEELKDLPGFQLTWDRLGASWMPYAIGLGYDVLFPVTGPAPLALDVASEAARAGAKGLRAGARLAEVAPVARAASRGGDITQAIAAGERAAGALRTTADVADFLASPVAQARRWSAVREARMASKGLTDAPDFARITDAHSVRNTAAEFVARETVGPAVVAVELAGRTGKIPVRELTALGGESNTVRRVAASLVDEAGMVDAQSVVRLLNEHRAALVAASDTDDVVKGAVDLAEAGARSANQGVSGTVIGDLIRRYAHIGGRRTMGRGYANAHDVTAAVADIIGEKLLNRVPDDLIFITPSVVVDRNRWLRGGQRVIDRTAKRMEGTWDDAGENITLARGGKTLSHDEYLTAYNRELGSEARQAGFGQELRLWGRAAREADVPVGRRWTQPVADLATTGRGLRDMAIDLGARTGVIPSTSRALNRTSKELGAMAATAGKSTPATPLVVHRALEEIAGRTARITDDIKDELSALRREIAADVASGKARPISDGESVESRAMDELVAAHGGESMTADDWAEIAEDFFGKSNKDLIDDYHAFYEWAHESGGEDLTADNLAKFIGNVRRGASGSLDKVGIKAPRVVPGTGLSDQDNLFATLIAWTARRKYERLVDDAVMSAVIDDPGLVPIVVGSDPARVGMGAATVARRAGLPSKVQEAAFWAGLALMEDDATVRQVTEELLSRKVATGRPRLESDMRSFIDRLPPGKPKSAMSELVSTMRAAGADDTAVRAVHEALIEQIDTTATAAAATWGALLDAPARDSLRTAGLQFGNVGRNQWRLAFGRELAADVQKLQDSVNSGDLTRSIDKLRVTDPKMADSVVDLAKDFLDTSRRAAIGGMLGGWLTPNFRYHGVNVLTAPLIQSVTVGPAAAARATPRTVAQMAMDGWRFMRGNTSRAPAKGFVDDIGRNWTAEQLDAAAKRNNIGRSQAGFEFGTDTLYDIMRSAKLTPAMAKVTTPEQLWRWWLNPAGKNIWSQMAEGADNSARRSIFYGAIKQGRTEQEAAELARNALLDYGKVTPEERAVVGQFMLFYAFRRQMTLETLMALASRPSDVRRLLIANREMDRQATRDGYLLPSYAQARLGLWGARQYDTVGTGGAGAAQFGPSSPVAEVVSDVANAANFVLTGGPLSGKLGDTLLSEVLFTPEIDIVTEMQEWGSGEKSTGMVHPRHVAALQAVGAWDSFVKTFRVEAVPMPPGEVDRRYPGGPVDKGGEQYRFRSAADRNRYLGLLYLLTRIGIKRNLDDNLQAAYNAGLIGEGDRKRYEQDQVGAMRYLMAAETPIGVKTQAQAEMREQQRLLAILRDMGADTQ